MSCDVAAARRKLRQAEILRDYLSGLPKEIAMDMRRARHADYTPALEALFSASFGAARACFFILRSTGGPEFKSIESNWRNRVLDQEQRRRWNAMLAIRDNDVHVGQMPAATAATMMKADQDESSLYNHYNAALFGPIAAIEHINPDGEPIRAQALQGTVDLYLDIAGETVRGTTACDRFIAHMRSLIDAVEAAQTSTTVSTIEIPANPG